MDVKDPDYFEIGNWTSDQSDFTVGTWNPDAEPESETSVSFFDHVSSAYGDTSNLTGSGSKQSDSMLSETYRDRQKTDGLDSTHADGMEDVEWGYGESGDLPGISLVSGVSNTIMKAIEKDLTNFDDSGMAEENNDNGEVFARESLWKDK